MKYSLRITALALAALLALTPATHAASSLVVPNANAAVEGNAENSIPFGTPSFITPSVRYQQIYGASGFSALAGPSLITDIFFRPSSNASGFNATLNNVQINLSTTSALVDNLSSTFATNVGADDTIVHSGPLTLSSAFTGPVGGPMDFDVLIHLTTPFLYNPAAGNLLLDVRNFETISTLFFLDASNNDSDEVSRVLSTASGVDALASDVEDSIGLVTKFTFAGAPTSVPLPAALPAGLALLTTLGLTQRLRRKA